MVSFWCCVRKVDELSVGEMVEFVGVYHSIADAIGVGVRTAS